MSTRLIAIAVVAATILMIGHDRVGAVETVLTHVRDIRLLPPENAAEGVPVCLEAVITFMDADTTVFVQDADAGTFFRDVPRDPDWRVGQRVRIEGKTFPGLYVPGIRASHVENLGPGERPEPIRVSVDDLASGRFHYQWVEIEGVGHALVSIGENASVLRLAVGSNTLKVHVDQAAPPDLRLVDARLRVRGLAAGGINNRRQLVSPYLKTDSFREVQVVDPPPDLRNVALISVPELLRFAPNGATDRRVKVQGIVVSHGLAGHVFLREGDEALMVESDQAEPFGPGDVVEAVGFPRMGTFRAYLDDAILHRVGSAPIPNPRRLSVRELRAGRGDADLVALDGLLMAHINDADGDGLALQTGATVFHVRSPNGAFPTWRTGSHLSATGICRIAGSLVKGYNQTPASFDLWVCSPDDVRLVSTPSWWTSRRLAWGLVLFAAATAGALSWIFVLLRGLRAQRAVIRSQRERQAIVEERTRIAREVHDSLEQELVGLSLRIDAVAAVADPSLRVMLDVTGRLVARIQAEIRHLIWDLREQDDAPRDLGHRLELLSRQWGQTSRIPIRVVVTGAPWPLSSVAEHNLLRVAQEALTNALKHADPNSIAIDLAYEPDRLSLRIADDGRGFQNGDLAAVPAGHFGLVGMRERARKLGVPLHLSSHAGQGTTVEVVVPRRTEQTEDES